MDQNQSRRVRLLFQTETSYYRFCWFKQEGDDLYWGSSEGNVIRGAVATADEQGMTLTVPDEIERAEGERVKASFHASGQFHIKRGRELEGPSQHWRLKNQITAPYRVAALLTKHPVLYEPYTRALTRGQTSAQAFLVDSEQAATRHYFEFFVSPEGQFPLPPTILSLSPTVNVEPICFSLNEQLILAIRHLVIAPESALTTWHPELEVWIYGSDNSNAFIETK